MAVAALVFWAILEPGDKTRELFDRLLVGLAPFFSRGQLGLAQHARLRVAAGPGNDRRRPRREQVAPIEGAVFRVEADVAVFDLVLADVVAVEVQIKRGLELAGMGAAAGELALPPARQKLLVDRQQVPPAGQN